MAAGKRSAGLLLYRRTRAVTEVLIAHMGGPFWAGKDEGAWSIPKGEYEDDEEPLAVALREFEEEIGTPPPAGVVVELGEFRQPGGKRVAVFVQEGDLARQGRGLDGVCLVGAPVRPCCDVPTCVAATTNAPCESLSPTVHASSAAGSDMLISGS